MVLGKRHLCLCALAALGCATSGADTSVHEDHMPGAWHVVEAGETSLSIARRAGIPLDDFLEINGLHRSDPLEPGRPVFLFGNTQGLPPAEPGQPAATASPEPAPAARPAPGERAAILRWPVAAPRLTSRFGKRWGKPHEGIDMAAPIGTSVFAASTGSVIYSGDQVRGYGNMVVVKHADDLSTVYAHNSVLLVHTGDRVMAGQEIARVGDTGRSTAPHLHFEVRRRDAPQDPLQFLPALK
jgi:murein DD-endopeptidase MepM/ murein hydrolase activator NlpD